MTSRDSVTTEISDKQRQPTGLGEDHSASVASKMLDEAGKFGAALKDSFVYSAIQSPITGAAQIVDHLAGTHTADTLNFVPKPVDAKFGSAEWHAQQFGSGLGIAADFYVTSKILGKSAKSVRTSSAEGVTASSAIMRSAVTGAVYQGVFTPTSGQNENFWQSRLESAGSGAATFATLTGTSIGLRSVLKPSGAGASILSKMVRSDAALGLVSGIPAGIVAAQTSSVFHGQGFASVEQTAQSAYGFSVAGGPLGLAHALGAKSEGSIPSPERPHDIADGIGSRLESLLPRTSEMLAPAAREVFEKANILDRAQSAAISDNSGRDQLSENYDRLTAEPRKLDLTQDATSEITSSRSRNLSLDRYSSDGKITTVKVPATIIKLGSSNIEIVIPEATERGALQTRAWRTLAATFSEEQKSEFEFLLHTAPERVGLSTDGFLRNDFREQVLPEQLRPFLDELPNSDLVKRVILWHDSGGNAAADAKGGDINLYNFNELQIPFLRTLLFHEWAHVAENRAPEEAKPFYSAAALEQHGYYASDYSRTNSRENLAVHLGEEFLALDADNFFMLSSQAPLRTVALAEMMRSALVRARANGTASIYHDEFVDRLKFVDTDVVPWARASIGRNLGMDPSDAANALQFLKDINQTNPALAYRLADFPQIERLAKSKLGEGPVDSRRLNDLISKAQARVDVDDLVDKSYSTNREISSEALEDMSKAHPDSAIGRALREMMHYRLTAGGDEARGALDWLYKFNHHEEAATIYAPPQLLEKMIHSDADWNVAADALALYLSPAYIEARGPSFKPMTLEIYNEAKAILSGADDESAAHLLNSLGNPKNWWNQPITPEISKIVEDAMVRKDRKQSFITALTVAAENTNMELKSKGIEIMADRVVRGKSKVEDLYFILSRALSGAPESERQIIASTTLRFIPRSDRKSFVEALAHAGMRGADLRAFDRAIPVL